MIQLFIDEKPCELPQDIELSFIFENSLFLFDELKLNRTQSFKIPRTPNNDALFQLAHLPELEGKFVRTIKNAELHYSGGKIDGELLIENYSDKNYNCILIYGELMKLREIIESGKLSNSISSNFNTFWGNTNQPQKPSLITQYGIANYMNGVSIINIPTRINLLPSARASFIFSQISSKFNIIFNFGNVKNYINSIFIKTNSLKKFKHPPTHLVEGDYINGTYLFKITSPITISEYFEVERRTFLDAIGNWVYLYGIRAKQNVTFDLTFQYPNTIQKGIVFFNRRLIFYGKNPKELWEDYSNFGIKQTGVTKINMESGDEIYWQDVDNLRAFNGFDDFGFYKLTTVSPLGMFQFYNIFGDLYTIDYNDTINYKNNTPDIETINFIKMMLKLSGTGIIIKDNIFEFYDYNFSETPIDINNKIIEIKSINRNVFNFSQKNIRNFKSLDYVKHNITDNKYIKNENISEENKFVEIEFSETELDVINIEPFAFSDDIDFVYPGNDPFKIIYEGKSELFYDKGRDYLDRIFFNYNPYFDKILDKSTTVVATFFMYLFQAHEINEKSTFILKNKRYTWSSGKWKNNVMELELILID